MKSLVAAVALACCLVAGARGVRAHGSMVKPVWGLGLATDFAYDGAPDGGLYATGKLGFIGILGGMVHLDAGYRFERRQVRLRAGVEAYAWVFGLQIDYVSAIAVDEPSHRPGIAYAAVVMIPAASRVLAFLSVGGQSILDHGSELVIGLTVLFGTGI